MGNVKSGAVLPTPIGELFICVEGDAILSIGFDEIELAVLPHHPVLEAAVQQLSAYFAGELRHFNLPLAARGTVFQQRVWALLSTVAYGNTQSYKQMAIGLGDEKCIRALGTANGKNPWAIVVPCHRVIGSQGQLVGYAGGLRRKQWLLQHEAAAVGRTTQPALF